MWFCASISSQERTTTTTTTSEATATATAALQQYNKKRVRRHSLLLFSLSSVFLCFAALLFAVHLRTSRSRTVITAYILLDRFVKMLLGLLHEQLSKVSTYTYTHTRRNKKKNTHKHTLTHTHEHKHSYTCFVERSRRACCLSRLASVFSSPSSHSIGAERRRDDDNVGDWKIGIFSAALQR